MNTHQNIYKLIMDETFEKLDLVFGVRDLQGWQRTECWPWKSESEQFLHKSASDVAFNEDENGDNDNISLTFGADLHAVFCQWFTTLAK